MIKICKWWFHHEIVDASSPKNGTLNIMSCTALEGHLFFSIWYSPRSPSFRLTKDTIPAATCVCRAKRRCWFEWILRHIPWDLSVEGDSWITNINALFLHERPWIPLWIKSIFNKLNIIFHLLPSQLPCHIMRCANNCDVTTNVAQSIVTSPIESKQTKWGAVSMRENRLFDRHLWAHQVVQEMK